MPAEIHELVDADGTPFIKGQARDVAESYASYRVILRDVPGAGSGDIEELGREYRVLSVVLAVERVLLGQRCEFGKKFGLVHGVKS